MRTTIVTAACVLAMMGGPVLAAPVVKEPKKIEIQKPVVDIFPDNNRDLISLGVDSRKDVREVTLPQQTYGQATPVICGPSSYICP